MLGAPALCARGALRAGCGSVRIASSADTLPYCLVVEPSATGIELPRECVEDWVGSLDAKAVLAIGPGMGTGPAQQELIGLLLQLPNDKVLDADGLNNLTALRKSRRAGSIVMTPHPGEFSRLAAPVGITTDPTNVAERGQCAQDLAKAYAGIVVLKGHFTVISDGYHTVINQSGNVALAIPGSGDVLTGIIAALIAQGLSPYPAAVLGVYLHGLAGDVWAKRHGSSGLVARDLADLLPDAFQLYRQFPSGEVDLTR